LGERGLALSEEQMRQEEKATRMANIIATGSLGTQAYLGYKMYGGGAAATTTGGAATTVAPQAGAVAGGGAELPASTIGTEASVMGGGPSTTGAGGTSTLGYLFAAYVGYKLWQAEKKRGAKYPGQPLLQSTGKSLAKSDIGKRLGL